MESFSGKKTRLYLLYFFKTQELEGEETREKVFKNKLYNGGKNWKSIFLIYKNNKKTL